MTDPRELMLVSSEDFLFVVTLNPSDFSTEVIGWRDSGLTVRVVRGLKMVGFDGLMAEFAAALQFPYYFGENWVAFQECLEDMDWLPTGQGVVIAVMDAADVLSDETDADLGVLVRSFMRAQATYARPVADGEWWDRPAIPFHVVLQCDPKSPKRLDKWLDAGALLKPISSVSDF